MPILDKIFGTHSDRELKKIKPLVDGVLALDESMQKLSDDELRAKTTEFKERLANGETLDDLLVEAFAVVREAAWRAIGLKPFPVQITGGIILHQGRLAEMRTGEGKTLVSTMPAYLNALEGKGVHIVTVNDYLAKRDSDWMGNVHRFLGLTVSAIMHDFSTEERQEAYKADITYITNNELGFDYLRDNMAVYKERLVQRGLHYAIIDEIDSILIDEARTPLIISGQSGKSTEIYKMCDYLARRMQRGTASTEISKMDAIMGTDIEEDGDYLVNEKDKFIVFTEQGVKEIEQFFHIDNLTDPENLEIHHTMLQAIKAHALMHRDQDYVVKDDEVLIVDEFTGRIMPGRRFNEGLHQAIEAKENVKVKRESKTLATITFQNFFNKYNKKAGMTGTAQTEEIEFREIYGMDVVVVPTNKPIARIDYNDSIFKTKKEKLDAIVESVVEAHGKNQPVLVGTVNIDSSEEISKLLKNRGIKHNVLNAKYHEQEAEIVAQAGRAGAVTIATNMAGRGTDITLGGNVKSMIPEILRSHHIKEEMATPEQIKDAEKEAAEIVEKEAEIVRAAGGLKVIGTERHESRRIDNQLRGRSGRQGDPGESKFYLSLEDDLMRLFGSERVMGVYDALKIPEGEEIEHKTITNFVERAQKKIESNNFAVRKSLLEYDQVNNEQREVIYAERRKVLDGENMHETVREMIEDTVAAYVDKIASGESDPSEWDMKELSSMLNPIIPFGKIELTEEEKERGNVAKLKERLQKEALEMYEARCEEEFENEEQVEEIERVVMLKTVDRKWMDNIDDMEQLRQGIGLQGYGNRDPVVEYKLAGFDMFNDMIASIKEETASIMFHIKLKPQEEVKREQVAKETGTNKDETLKKEPTKRKEKKIGRNDPCPCGSGKKYKNCCGRGK
ncbi:MAG: preprotein translocase subunit SecA [Eubacterium sp.]|nr:preprotein translocase subunit SecA [Eubacterium sp.]